MENEEERDSPAEVERKEKIQLGNEKIAENSENFENLHKSSHPAADRNLAQTPIQPLKGILFLYINYRLFDFNQAPI